MRRSFFRFVCCMLVVGFFLYACSSKKTSTTGAESVDANLTAVSGKFLPSSLSYSATRTQILRNPCAGLDVFACQPILLRLYVSLAKTMFDATRSVFSGVKDEVDSYADNTTATGTADGFTFEGSKTDSDTFKVLLLKNTKPAVYIEVDGSTYTMKGDITALGQGTGKMEVQVTFTDENTWKVDAWVTEMGCSSTDPRAPDIIRVLMDKTESLWKGKATFYSPRWVATDPTCNDTPTDANGILFYTDFVGNNDAAKANVYTLLRNKTTVDTSFPLNEICPDIITSGTQANCMGVNISSYINPFCNPTSTNNALWNNSCTSHSSAVSSATFGPESDWVVPSKFYIKTVSLPTTIL